MQSADLSVRCVDWLRPGSHNEILVQGLGKSYMQSVAGRPRSAPAFSHNGRVVKTLSLLWLCLPLAFNLACTSPQPTNRRVPLQGEVVYLYRDAHRVVLRHEAVPGWGQAGLTEIPVRDEVEYRKLKVGQRIAATVIIEGPSEQIVDIEVLRDASTPESSDGLPR